MRKQEGGKNKKMFIRAFLVLSSTVVNCLGRWRISTQCEELYCIETTGLSGYPNIFVTRIDQMVCCKTVVKSNPLDPCVSKIANQSIRPPKGNS